MKLADRVYDAMGMSGESHLSTEQARSKFPFPVHITITTMKHFVCSEIQAQALPLKPARWLLAPLLALSLSAAQATIVNGGFELGPSDGPADGWTDTDNVFGFVRCSVDICGTGEGTAGPQSGSYWSWFGGSPDAQFATLSQSTFIESTANALLFSFWTGLSDAEALINLTLDGTSLWMVTNATAGAYAAGYTPVSIALGGFADNAFHELRWTYADAASGDTNTNWSLDNVRLAQSQFVPEPGTLALMALSLAALATTVRRKR